MVESVEDMADMHSILVERLLGEMSISVQMPRFSPRVLFPDEEEAPSITLSASPAAPPLYDWSVCLSIRDQTFKSYDPDVQVQIETEFQRGTASVTITVRGGARYRIEFARMLQISVVDYSRVRPVKRTPEMIQPSPQPSSSRPSSSSDSSAAPLPPPTAPLSSRLFFGRSAVDLLEEISVPVDLIRQLLTRYDGDAFLAAAEYADSTRGPRDAVCISVGNHASASVLTDPTAEFAPADPSPRQKHLAWRVGNNVRYSELRLLRGELDAVKTFERNGDLYATDGGIVRLLPRLRGAQIVRSPATGKVVDAITTNYNVRNCFSSPSGDPQHGPSEAVSKHIAEVAQRTIAYVETIGASATRLCLSIKDHLDNGNALLPMSPHRTIVSDAAKFSAAYNGVVPVTSMKQANVVALLTPTHWVVGAGPASAINIEPTLMTVTRALGITPRGTVY